MKPHGTSGTFIVFEGPDGSGKSLQAEMLAAYLRDKGHVVHLTYEPTDEGEAAQRIKDVLEHRTTMDLEDLQRLYVEDRKKHLEEMILPRLVKGDIVISDRYYYSTFAYGMLKAPIDRFIAMNDRFPSPDIAILLDVDAKTCIARIIARREEGKDVQVEYFEKEEKLRKITENYKTFLPRFKEMALIDGNRTPAEIHADVVGAVQNVLQ